MNIDMSGMGIYGFIGILSVILGFVKELLIIFLLFRGVQIANIYIKKNKDENIVETIEELDQDKSEEN